MFKEKVEKTQDCVDDVNTNYVTRKMFHPIPAIDYEGAQVEFCGVTFCTKEKYIELGFWMKNELLDELWVFIETFVINGMLINEEVIGDDIDEEYFFLGEYKAGKADYSYVVINEEILRGICSYEEIETIEFKIEISDSDVSILCNPEKYTILCDVKHEKFQVVKTVEKVD